MKYSFIAIAPRFSLTLSSSSRFHLFVKLDMFKNYFYLIGPCAQGKKTLNNTKNVIL